MEIVGSTVLPVVLPQEDQDRNISIRIVHDFPYALNVGASFFRLRGTVFLLGECKVFHPSPGVPWVPLQP